MCWSNVEVRAGVVFYVSESLYEDKSTRISMRVFVFS